MAKLAVSSARSVPVPPLGASFVISSSLPNSVYVYAAAAECLIAILAPVFVQVNACEAATFLCRIFWKDLSVVRHFLYSTISRWL